MTPIRENLPSNWRRWLALAVLLFSATLSVAAAPVRVTTWSLPPTESESTTNLAAQSADVLKKLDADVILLQHVPDWKTCNELVASLKPANYKVAICSSFRDARSGKLSRDQTAILAKATAYISWAEAWQGADQKPIGGGFAFAALRVSGKSIGVFCVEPEHNGRSGDSAAQLLKQIDSLNEWTANKVDSRLVAGNFSSVDTTNLPGRLINAGFADAIAGLPDRGGQPENSNDLILVREAGRALKTVNADIASAHSPVTVELDLGAPPIPTPAKAVVVQKPTAIPATPTNATAESQASKTSVATAVPTLVAPPDNRWLFGAGAGVVVLVVIATWLSHRPARQVVSVPAKIGASSQLTKPATTAATASVERPTIINIDATGAANTQSQYWQQRAEAAERRADEASRALQTGVMPQLGQWLRDRFTRRLATDRAVLMETQRTSAMRMVAVDERLAKVERELKDRYRVYERRIDELLKELAVAREENRELIRARIELLKAEMEKERARSGSARED